MFKYTTGMAVVNAACPAMNAPSEDEPVHSRLQKKHCRDKDKVDAQSLAK